MMYHETATPRIPTPTPERYIQLTVGLALYGVSIALILSAGLGVDSWDVFHQGIAERTGLSFGWIVTGVSLTVLAIWIPLRQRPGMGTIANALVVGLVADATLAVLPRPGHLAVQVPMLAWESSPTASPPASTSAPDWGPGPRDGLMTRLAARTRWSIRLVRTVIELVVLTVGWVLGGPVGIGTLLYAVSIGPLAQILIARFGLTRGAA